MPGSNAHLAVCKRKRATRGAGLTHAPPRRRVRGGGFFQPAPLQHGSTIVQHLCGGAAVAGGPEAQSPGRCGCNAVSAGPRVGERLARAGRAGAGTGSRSGEWADSGLESIWLEAGARCRPGVKLSVKNGGDGKGMRRVFVLVDSWLWAQNERWNE